MAFIFVNICIGCNIFHLKQIIMQCAWKEMDDLFFFLHECMSSYPHQTFAKSSSFSDFSTSYEH